MSESFRVGEIAIVGLCDYHRAYGLSDGMGKYMGTEVTIESPAEKVLGQSRPMHVVRSALDNSDFYSAPCCLRKRKPPQDWVKLCNLDEVKHEEPAYV